MIAEIVTYQRCVIMFLEAVYLRSIYLSEAIYQLLKGGERGCVSMELNG